MQRARTILAVLRGEAVVILKKDGRNADVVVGRLVNKRFAINSMVGAVKAMML
jgi:hypothetical protein